jgi:hypothetical protein
VTLLFSVYVAASIPAMLTLGRITDRVGPQAPSHPCYCLVAIPVLLAAQVPPLLSCW